LCLPRLVRRLSSPVWFVIRPGTALPPRRFAAGADGGDEASPSPPARRRDARVAAARDGGALASLMRRREARVGGGSALAAFLLVMISEVVLVPRERGRMVESGRAGGDISLEGGSAAGSRTGNGSRFGVGALAGAAELRLERRVNFGAFDSIGEAVSTGLVVLIVRICLGGDDGFGEDADSGDGANWKGGVCAAVVGTGEPGFEPAGPSGTFVVAVSMTASGARHGPKAAPRVKFSGATADAVARFGNVRSLTFLGAGFPTDSAVVVDETSALTSGLGLASRFRFLSAFGGCAFIMEGCARVIVP